MSLLSTLKSFTAPRELFARSQNGALGHALVARSLDLDVLVPDPLQNGVVAACVNAVAKALPDAPLLLENRSMDGWQEVPDHECLRVLRAPNADHSDADVWGLTSGYKATRGQAFWLLLPDKLGRVGEIHVWNPDLVTVLGDESQFISGYRIRRENGVSFEVSRSGVIHFRHLPDFHNPRLGWNPLRTGRAQIAGDNIGSSYHTSILHNAGVVSLLISLKEGAATGQVTPEQFQQVLTNIRRASRERSGGVEGINLPLEVHKLAYSPDEMNVDKLIEYYETRICSVMGVSQRVAGLGSDPTYNNLSEALSDFWERRIVPDRNADAATLNRQWLPLFGLDDGNWRFRFDYSGVPALQENRDALHARVRADFEKGLVDKKQARALLGYGTSNDEAFAGVFFGGKPKTSTDADGSFKGIWDEADHPRDKDGRFTSGGMNWSVSPASWLDSGVQLSQGANGSQGGNSDSSANEGTVYRGGAGADAQSSIVSGEATGLEIGVIPGSRLPSGISAEVHLHDMIRGNSSLSEKNRDDYTASISKVLKRIPTAMQARITNNVKGVVAVNGMDELREFLIDRWKTKPEKARRAMGAWHPRQLVLLLDGEQPLLEAMEQGENPLDRENIYAHEISHVLDRREDGTRISQSPEWIKAFEKEIFYNEHSVVSQYAKTHPSEAFAELGRLIYTSPDPRFAVDIFGAMTPDCVAIMQKEGLLP